MESLYDKVFEEVFSCLKFSSNGLTAVTDKDSKARLELALEITQSVMERVEENLHPVKAIPADFNKEATKRYFKSNDERVWSTEGNTIIRYAYENSQLVGYAEQEIYETTDNLAACEDVTEIDQGEFDQIIKTWKTPF